AVRCCPTARGSQRARTTAGTSPPIVRSSRSLPRSPRAARRSRRTAAPSARSRLRRGDLSWSAELRTCSGSEGREVSGRVAIAGACAGFEGGGEKSQFLVIEGKRNGRDVQLEPLLLLRARDGDDVVALREEPGERDLRLGQAVRGGDRVQRLEQLQVALEVARLEARLQAAQIVLRDVVERAHVAG